MHTSWRQLIILPAFYETAQNIPTFYETTHNIPAFYILGTDSPCLCISWQKNNNHQFIMAGFGNGMSSRFATFILISNNWLISFIYSINALADHACTCMINRICYLCLTEIDLSQSRVVCCNKSQSRSTTDNRLFFSYPRPANKLQTNALEVSTRQAVPDRKNLAILIYYHSNRPS